MTPDVGPPETLAGAGSYTGRGAVELGGRAEALSWHTEAVGQPPPGSSLPCCRAWEHFRHIHPSLPACFRAGLGVVPNPVASWFSSQRPEAEGREGTRVSAGPAHSTGGGRWAGVLETWGPLRDLSGTWDQEAPHPGEDPSWPTGGPVTTSPVEGHTQQPVGRRCAVRKQAPCCLSLSFPFWV